MVGIFFMRVHHLCILEAVKLLEKLYQKILFPMGTELSGIHGWALEYYSPDDYRSLDDSLADRPLAAAHSEMLGCDFKIGGPSDLAEPIVRVQFVGFKESQVSEILESMSGKGNVSVATSPVLEGAAFISITKKGVNKGSAILRMCEMLSLDVAEGDDGR
ncbi:MAG: hypothetical protein Ct9H90mP5_05850 [Acidimicrobiaceae bacterium]|nr:MAG: hypothetical protein Ct9H90mP5_05850 [Acidimicrobiaceae bacterium]